MAAKRYYWLKLHDDFFSSLRIKKLRKMAGGDTYTIIYLKIQLIAMKHEGVISYTCDGDDFAENLALDIDEDVDNVRMTMHYLLATGLAETSDGVSFYFPYSIENVGSEQSSAQRVRDYREKQKALQCNNDVTPVKQICNGEKEIDIEIEKEIDIENKPAPKRKKRFTKPTYEEVAAYCNERKNQIDARYWWDYYESKGWKIGKETMKDWKAAVRTWERNGFHNKQQEQPESQSNASYDLGKWTNSSINSPLKYERKQK